MVESQSAESSGNEDQILVREFCSNGACVKVEELEAKLDNRGGRVFSEGRVVPQPRGADLKNERNDTALIPAKKDGGGEAADVILDYKVREIVLEGRMLKKHSRGGREERRWRWLWRRGYSDGRSGGGGGGRRA
ncbi:hypothetical protein LINPERHAP2_LOCUS7060, partial [Linum perenne]